MSFDALKDNIEGWSVPEKLSQPKTHLESFESSTFLSIDVLVALFYLFLFTGFHSACLLTGHRIAAFTIVTVAVSLCTWPLGIIELLWYCRNYTPVTVALKPFDYKFKIFRGDCA